MNEDYMNPETRKAPSLSSLKRTNAAIKRAIRKQQAVCVAMAEQKELIQSHQDLVDFNAGRIFGKPEDFVPKLKDAIAKKLHEQETRLGTRF